MRGPRSGRGASLPDPGGRGNVRDAGPLAELRGERIDNNGGKPVLSQNATHSAVPPGLPVSLPVPHRKENRLGLQETAPEDRLSHDQPVGVGEQEVIPAVAAPRGLLHERAMVQHVGGAPGPVLPGAVDARRQEIFAIKRQDDRALSAAFPQTFVEDHVPAACHRGVTNVHVQPVQDRGDLFFHGAGSRVREVRGALPRRIHAVPGERHDRRDAKLVQHGLVHGDVAAQELELAPGAGQVGIGAVAAGTGVAAVFRGLVLASEKQETLGHRGDGPVVPAGGVFPRLDADADDLARKALGHPTISHDQAQAGGVDPGVGSAAPSKCPDVELPGAREVRMVGGAVSLDQPQLLVHAAENPEGFLVEVSWFMSPARRSRAVARNPHAISCRLNNWVSRT